MSAGTTAGDVGERLVAAIHEGTLTSTVTALRADLAADDEVGGRLLADASAALEAIGRDGVAAIDALAADLDAAGIGHRFDGAVADARGATVPTLARIAIDVHVAPGDAAAAVDQARAAGYRPWYDLEDGAWAAYRRLYPALPLVAETPVGHPIVLRIAWGRLDGTDIAGAGTVPGQRLGRLRPPAEDLARTRLPGRLWWGHVVIRPFRVGYGRVRRTPAREDLGPFLPTPSGLVDALLDVADVGPDDVVADVGCGDGRVLVRAAADRGCRAIGVERDPALAAEARRQAERAGVGDRVEVVAGEASAFDVRRATVVVLFLSAASLPAVVADLRARLAPGSRIVAHEQAPLTVTADVRRPLLTSGGITVAHRWEV